MSQVRISGNASGTGIFTVAAPNTNTNYTLTLPTNTGTLVTTSSTGVIAYAQLLSTDWTNSQAATGYQKLPSGVIVQWGSWNGGAAASGTNSFPLTFPNGVFSMIFGTSSNGTAGYGAPISNSQYNWNRNSGSSNSGTWVAFGY